MNVSGEPAVHVRGWVNSAQSFDIQTTKLEWTFSGFLTMNFKTNKKQNFEVAIFVYFVLTM